MQAVIWLLVAWLAWIFEYWQLHGGPNFLPGPASWHLGIAPILTPPVLWAWREERRHQRERRRDVGDVS